MEKLGCCGFAILGTPFRMKICQGTLHKISIDMEDFSGLGDATVSGP